jgi:uncharacterized protein
VVQSQDDAAGKVFGKMPDAMVSGNRYAVAALVFLSVIVYRFFKLHIIGDLLRGFRGGSVELTFHPASEIYHRVMSK